MLSRPVGSASFAWLRAAGVNALRDLRISPQKQTGTGGSPPLNQSRLTRPSRANQ